MQVPGLMLFERDKAIEVARATAARYVAGDGGLLTAVVDAIAALPPVITHDMVDRAAEAFHKSLSGPFVAPNQPFRHALEAALSASEETDEH